MHNWFANHSSEIMIGIAIAAPLALVFAVLVVYWGFDEYAHAIKTAAKEQGCRKVCRPAAETDFRIRELQKYVRFGQGHGCVIPAIFTT